MTEGIPEQVTKGRHFDLNSSGSQKHTHTYTQTTVPDPEQPCPQVPARLKDGRNSRCFAAVVGCDLVEDGCRGRLAGGGH